MDFFNLFSAVLFIAVMTFALLLCIYIYFFMGARAHRALKPVCYISYKKIIFMKILSLYVNFVDQRYLPRTKSARRAPVILAKIKNIKLRNEPCTKGI